MIIKTVPSGPFETNAYIAACPLTRQAAIIDPAPESTASLVSFIEAQSLKPQAILLTHSHWDHIADVTFIKKHYAIPIFIHPFDAGNLEAPGSDRLPCWLDFPGIKPDKLLKEDDVITIGELQFKVIHTPGHTPGGVCFYEGTHHILFSGDTLFKGTIGNISFPTAQPPLMWDSLKKLAALPANTKVYPGHGPETTIGAERWLVRAEEIFGN